MNEVKHLKYLNMATRLPPCPRPLILVMPPTLAFEVTHVKYLTMAITLPPCPRPLTLIMPAQLGALPNVKPRQTLS
jgi:hypothetical protein